jgi:hypothetical protein
MKKKKTNLFPKTIPWPPPLWGFTKTGRIKKLTKNEVVQGDYSFLLIVYPEMKELLDKLFDCLPDDYVPLLIGKDYPGWVKGYIEKRLRKPSKESEKV